jgi:hypothetical protein
MKVLTVVIGDAAVRRQVVDATVALVEREVEAKGGISGFAIKQGFKAVRGLKNGRMIHDVVDGLLPEFAGAIAPLHAEYAAAPTASGFGGFLSSRGDRAANALLSITDARARKTDNAVLRKTYEALRSTGEKHVKEALPGVGQLVDRFTKS